MVSISGTTQTGESELDVQEIGGTALEDFDPGTLSLLRRIGSGDATPGHVGALRTDLNNAVMNPDFKTQQSLIDRIISQTQGKQALRGLGPATAEQKAISTLPTLLDQQSREQAFLQQAFGQESGLQQQIVDQMLQALTGLADEERPTVIGGTSGESKLFSMGGGVGSGILEFLL